MSRGFVKDGDQEDVPVVTPRAYLPAGVPNYVTPEGLEALNREKDEIISQRDNASGNETDRRITVNYLNARLALLEERIASAVVKKPEDSPEGVAGFGSYIRLVVEKSGTERVFRITGADEADSKKGFISFFSPLARAVAGHRQGDRFEVELPGGKFMIRMVTVPGSAGIMPSACRERFVSPLRGMPEDNSGTASGQTDGSSAYAVTPEGASKMMSAGPVKKKTVGISPSGIVSDRKNGNQEPIRKDDAEEVFPIVDERGITIGRAFRWQCHDGSKLLHPVVHLHIFNSRGELYLQKRPLWKDIQPGKWDTAVGGHVGFGEKIEAALQREAQEELGISDFKPVFLKRYVFESAREKELVHVYKAVYDGPVMPSSELDGGRFWTREEILTSMGQKLFTPNFESEFRKMGF